MNKTIKLLIVLFFSGSVWAGLPSVSGKVIDENNSPIPGANVFLKGSVLGSATNKDGKFRILNIPTGNLTISITVIGFKEKKY